MNPDHLIFLCQKFRSILDSVDPGTMTIAIFSSIAPFLAAIIVYRLEKKHEKNKDKEETLRRYDKLRKLLSGLQVDPPYQVVQGKRPPHPNDLKRSTESYKRAILAYKDRCKLINSFLEIIMPDLLLYGSAKQINNSISINNSLKSIAGRDKRPTGSNNTNQSNNALYMKEYEEIKSYYEALVDFFDVP